MTRIPDYGILPTSNGGRTKARTRFSMAQRPSADLNNHSTNKERMRVHACERLSTTAKRKTPQKALPVLQRFAVCSRTQRQQVSDRRAAGR